MEEVQTPSPNKFSSDGSPLKRVPLKEDIEEFYQKYEYCVMGRYGAKTSKRITRSGS